MLVDFRDLPSVHQLAEALATPHIPREVAVAELRRVLHRARLHIQAGAAPDVTADAAGALAALTAPSLRRVINATGVVLHTNLGRAPLGPWQPLPGYSNLEYDLAAGRRGQRDTHTAALLERLLDVPGREVSGIVVNNNAAALFLALHALAAGHEVIVSRGELIEIGDGFRIPDIMASSGAILREVGTTNRTRIEDYRDAITGRTRLLLRVHPSNFEMRGFTARPTLAELAALGRERAIPVYEDLGSGCLTDLRPFGIREPLVPDSLRAGVDLVSFSADKLLGGPQAGILAGRPELIARLRRNPMFRALRVDKLIYQSLECTLRNLLLERWDAIPALRMFRQTGDEIRARAEALLEGAPVLAASLIEGESVIGGGATPDQSIPTWLIALEVANPVAAEKKLRGGEPPIIARIEHNRLLFDLRTVLPEEEPELQTAIRSL